MDTLVVTFRRFVEQHPDLCEFTSGRRSSRLLQQARGNAGTCRRFLTARGNDPEAAACMFAETVLWRAEQGIDDLLTQPHPEVGEAARLVDEGYPHGMDCHGRPVMIHELHRLNVGRVLERFEPAECLRYTMHWAEFRSRYLLDDGGDSQFSAIVDLRALGMRHMDMRLLAFLRDLFSISQRHYPETMGQVVVVNAGAVFTAAWQFLRPFLHAHTRAKIVVCSNGQAANQLLPPERLPACYGGQCKASECTGARAWAAYQRICELGTAGLGLPNEAAVRAWVRGEFGLTTGPAPHRSLRDQQTRKERHSPYQLRPSPMTFRRAGEDGEAA